jgi:peroxiredoxin
MSPRWLRTPVLLLTLWAPTVDKEGLIADDTTPAAPAVQALDSVASRMTAFLSAVPTFHVDATMRWTLDGNTTHAGTSGYGLSVQHPNAFRLEVGSHADASGSLVCVSDGTSLTRLYRHGEMAIYSRRPGGLAQLLDDAMTDGSVKGTGLAVILRPDAHQFIMASASDIQDHGSEEIQGRPAHHFSMAWLGGARVELWVAADREPVLLKWVRKQPIHIGDQPHEMRIESEFRWSIAVEVKPNQLVVELPAGAIEVDDLQTFLLKGGTDKLVGSPAPLVSLPLLDGSTGELGKHRGAQAVVLFFFASWAAPSTRDMPAVLAFVEEFENRGVAFYAVASGETPEAVRAFVAAQRYAHPVVLDSDQKLTAAYRVTSLPVTVLIGKDGTVQAAHVGISPDERALIRQDLELLVQGQQLADTPR